jgi:hypothetical protein
MCFHFNNFLTVFWLSWHSAWRLCHSRCCWHIPSSDWRDSNSTSQKKAVPDCRGKHSEMVINNLVYTHCFNTFIDNIVKKMGKWSKLRLLTFQRKYADTDCPWKKFLILGCDGSFEDVDDINNITQVPLMCMSFMNYSLYIWWTIQSCINTNKHVGF